MIGNQKNYQNRVKATQKQISFLLVLLAKNGYPLVVDQGFASLGAKPEHIGKPVEEFLRTRTVMEASIMISNLKGPFWDYKKPV